MCNCAWYSCKRSSRRWPVSLFFGLLDITGVNAFVIWTELNPTWKCSQSGKQPSDTRRLFLLDVGESMVMPSAERRSLSPDVAFLPATRRAMTAIGVSPVRKTSEPAASGKRKRCHLYTAKQDRKCRVNCDICHLPVCGDHMQSNNAQVSHVLGTDRRTGW